MPGLLHLHEWVLWQVLQPMGHAILQLQVGGRGWGLEPPHPLMGPVLLQLPARVQALGQAWALKAVGHGPLQLQEWGLQTVQEQALQKWGLPLVGPAGLPLMGRPRAPERALLWVHEQGLLQDGG